LIIIPITTPPTTTTTVQTVPTIAVVESSGKRQIKQFSIKGYKYEI
jgi:hypothetical protein